MERGRLTDADIQRLISIDPKVMRGRPVIRGTRILVEVILDELAAGDSTETLLENYPRLTEDGIRAALALAARSVRALGERQAAKAS